MESATMQEILWVYGGEELYWEDAKGCFLLWGSNIKLLFLILSFQLTLFWNDVTAQY